MSLSRHILRLGSRNSVAVPSSCTAALLQNGLPAQLKVRSGGMTASAGMHFYSRKHLNVRPAQNALSHNEVMMTSPGCFYSPETHIVSTTSTSHADKEYQCPSRILEHFSQLVILDNVTTMGSHYECPVSSHIRDSVIAPSKWEDEVSEPVTDHDTTSPGKYAKEIMKIRHRKMKKHKLKKLRKRMYFVWKKSKLARKTKREVIFRKELDEIRVAGDNFVAEDFVRQQLQKAKRGGYYVNVFQSKHS